jgi:hypothetical protein
VASVITLACVGLLAIHIGEPAARFTWAYSHLGRHWALPGLAGLVVGVVPLGVALGWRRPWASAPVQPLGWRRVVAATLVVMVVVVGVGLVWPVTPICIDAWYFVTAVSDGVTRNPRWYLTLWSFSGIAEWLRPWMGPILVVRVLNGLLAGGALMALAACARTLASTKGEAAAITALAWTAFGVLQLGLGYIDVYPIALCGTALYLWAGSAVLLRDRHPLWPTVIVAAGPFFYVGLVLLVPSWFVLLWAVARRPRGARRVLEAVGVAFAVAALATVPGYGSVAAWPAYVRDLGAVLAPGAAILGRGPLLPPHEIVSGANLLGLGHLLVLLDGVGVVLLLACGAAVIGRVPAALAAWALAILAAAAAYLLTMDPLFGAFADWDLFSYLAAATALWGAYAFVVWGRTRPRVFPVLLGLALATAVVHLLARLNALDVDFHRHLAETPFRVSVERR